MFCSIEKCDYCSSVGAREFFYSLEEEQVYSKAVSEFDVSVLSKYANDVFISDSKALLYGLLDNDNVNSSVLKTILEGSSSIDVFCRISIALHPAADLDLLDLIILNDSIYTLDDFHLKVCLFLMAALNELPVEVWGRIHGLGFEDVNQVLKFNDSVPLKFRS